MNTISVDRAVIQSCLSVFCGPTWRGETHTPSGESRAHFPRSQSKVGKTKVRNVLFLNGEGYWEIPGRHGLVLAKQLLGILDEADDDDDGGAGHADKEHDLEDMHGE